MPAVKDGLTQEQTARDEFKTYISKEHFEFRVDEVGLCLMSDYPFLGASRDGIVSCACCGRGTLEVKCPYKYKENLPTDNSDNHFPVRFNSQEVMLVKRDHDYYAKMQMHYVDDEDQILFSIFTLLD